MAIRNRRICLPIAMQAKILQKYFPASKTSTYMGIRLEWEGYLIPKPFSPQYKVRITYTLAKNPAVYVIEPKKLDVHPDEPKLPHVWDHDKQQICIYYPDGTEWNKSKLLAQTIVPWASEWLYFYEIWLETGKWRGGGTHPRRNWIE